MTEPKLNSLGTKLTPLFGSGFFRPLTRPTAPIYVDCADRLAEAAVNLTLMAPPDNCDSDVAKDEIRRRNSNVLNPQRAARFVEKHLPAKGDRVSTEERQLLAEDDLLDLLAVPAFDRGSADASRRSTRWRIHPARADFGTEPERIPRAAEAGRMVERFVLERLS